MAKLSTGTATVGSASDLITIPAGQNGNWAHGEGVAAVQISVLDDQGDSIDDLVVTQPDANTINVDNGTAGALSCSLVVTWEFGTIGASGAVPASAVVVGP